MANVSSQSILQSGKPGHTYIYAIKGDNVLITGKGQAISTAAVYPMEVFRLFPQPLCTQWKYLGYFHSRCVPNGSFQAISTAAVYPMEVFRLFPQWDDHAQVGPNQDFKNACPKQQSQNLCPSRFSYLSTSNPYTSYSVLARI